MERLVGLCKYFDRKQNPIKKDTPPVVRLPGGIVVKFGPTATPGKTATQQHAYQHLCPKVVRVPRVYRYFQCQDSSEPVWLFGYLFMEYIPGKTLDELDVDVYKDMTERLAGIVSHLHSVRGRNVPGPVGGGVPRGNIWGCHDAETVFGSVEDLNTCVNRRIAVINKSVDFRSYPLVLCHLDMCRRNIILMEDGSLCLLDWGFAGFLPRIYEVAAIEFYFDEYSEMFRQAVNETIVLTDQEKKDLVLIQRARAASMRYAFRVDIASVLHILEHRLTGAETTSDSTRGQSVLISALSLKEIDDFSNSQPLGGSRVGVVGGGIRHLIQTKFPFRSAHYGRWISFDHVELHGTSLSCEEIYGWRRRSFAWRALVDDIVFIDIPATCCEGRGGGANFAFMTALCERPSG
ncbi:hypothetical protein FQN51_005773 [Onygenales sp. PD_10]|nr:hypothetical protein FQN51_005773 [Onygenales sp. PD_10]